MREVERTCDLATRTCVFVLYVSVPITVSLTCTYAHLSEAGSLTMAYLLGFPSHIPWSLRRGQNRGLFPLRRTQDPIFLMWSKLAIPSSAVK